MSMKINKLEIENVKRVNAVKMEPAESGLTIIGGDNEQGKTSVLDSIAWALGGNKFKPSSPQHEGSTTDPYLSVTMNNGLRVERKGKNSSLVVTDPSGEKAGQQLLDGFVEELALDLPKFMEASDAEKAKTLLNIIGVGPQLEELERQESEAYNERTFVGRTAEQKDKFAREQTYYPDAPKNPISATDLIKQQQDILARNGENQRKREAKKELEAEKNDLIKSANEIDSQIESLNRQRSELEGKITQVSQDLVIASKTVAQLQDESTLEIEKSIELIDETNRKVSANLSKDRAEQDAKQYKDQYEELTDKIEEIRKAKIDLLNHANLPLPELSVVGGELTYQGQKWDNMSGSARLKVATAIIRKLNPECGFVLIDGLEGMDLKTLKEFGDWLDKEGLQAIATRVSKGDECQIVIEDGYAVKNSTIKPEQAPKKKSKVSEVKA